MAELWQFVSRSDMTRDKMSQALAAWGLGLVACGFFYFLGIRTSNPLAPVCVHLTAFHRVTDP